AFQVRALGGTGDGAGGGLADLIGVAEDGRFHFLREGKDGGALRILQVPVSEAEAPILFLLLDEIGAGGTGGTSLNGLLDILPLGLALADRDGRFVYLNGAFRRAAGLSQKAAPMWPSDLVV